MQKITPLARDLLPTSFQIEGASVIAAGTAGEAVAMARQQVFDLVFTDLTSPASC